MEYVGLGPRFLAALIDFVILIAISYGIALVSGGTTSTGFQLTGLPALLSMVITLSYGIVLEGLQGATVGKMLLGIKVVKINGFPLDWSGALLRNLLRIVDGLPFFIPYLTGAILIGSSTKRQRLGDRVAQTVVIRKIQ
jgi:uncharacterized RDD family membrane protein YckC